MKKEKITKLEIFSPIDISKKVCLYNCWENMGTSPS